MVGLLTAPGRGAGLQIHRPRGQDSSQPRRGWVAWHRQGQRLPSWPSGPDDDVHLVGVKGNVAGDVRDGVVRLAVGPHRVRPPAVGGDAVVGRVALVRAVGLGGAGREQRLIDVLERDVLDRRVVRLAQGQGGPWWWVVQPAMVELVALDVVKQPLQATLAGPPNVREPRSDFVAA
jgi:hypothetical protein